MAKAIKIEVNQLESDGFDHNFSYVVKSGAAAAVIDPCGDAELIFQALKDCSPCFVLLTHSHRDHCDALPELLRRIPMKVFSFYNLKDGERIPLGDSFITVLFTPGHTDDSVCYLSGESIFTGDTLFVDYIGFGNVEKLHKSLKLLRALADELTLYPGHDYGHAKSEQLGHEKKSNKFFQENSLENFKEIYKTLD